MTSADDRRLPTRPAVFPVSVVITLLLGLGGVAAGSYPAHAAGSPAETVPSDRWGTPAVMRPWKILGDSTNYDGSFIPRASTPIWFAADVSGDYLFTATGKGVMVHDLSTDPASPPRLGYSYINDALPKFFQSDLKFYVYYIDLPDENPNLGVTAGAGQGTVIWDFSQKTLPRVHYQDYNSAHGGTDASGVWASRQGSTDYAFVSNRGGGVNVFNMTAASSYSRCDSATGGCSNVWLGKVPITGLSADAVAGTGSFLAVGMGRSGLEIWNVANPRFAQLLLSGDPGGRYGAVALWQSGSRYYLATIDSVPVGGDYLTHIYDVTCIGTSSCAAANPLNAPVASLSSNGYAVGNLTLSQDQGRSYLYVGSLDRFSGGDQREFLWDVTDPKNALELTPDNAAGKGYWGWYYSGNATGFTNVAPVEAVVHNGYVYRAAWTILDVHELLGAAPPTADFTWSPQPVYQGQAVTFADQSSGAPSTWFWTFSGASPSRTQSTSKNPQVTFGSAGTATVRLTATNDSGTSDPVQKSVPILDPVPSVGSVTALPSAALVCQQVTFSANNVEGRPPLTYSWTVKDSFGSTVAGPITGTDTYAWNTAGAVTGSYTAEVTVSNSAGSTSVTSSAVTLSSPPAPAITSGPSTDPFNFGTVQFRATTQGGATWTWDFGDGTGQQAFTLQSDGENPVHNYTTIGTYTATLTVDNCIYPSVSAQVVVKVTQIDPLEVTQFEAATQCGVVRLPGGCFTAGKAVVFDQSIGGAPDTYEYDWDGNGTWDTATTSPVLNHTYATAGTYLPKLRVTRGTEPAVTVANGCDSSSPSCTGTEIVVGAAQPASVAISGSSSGKVDQALSFSASASNCTPSASGWNWNAGGGTLSGSGASVQITWSSAGNKTVTASNSACGGATGLKVVSITANSGGGGGGGGGGSNLTAAFTVSPASPAAGTAVTFDGSSSTGSPTGYTWDFGDGGTTTGKTVSHTFATGGTYAVKLTVSAPGDCESQVGGLNGICFDDTTKNVVVTEPDKVTASFSDDADCDGGQIGGAFCVVPTGQLVTFTDTSDGSVTQRTWSFGDGGTGSGKSVTHQWATPGTYTVTLSVQGDGTSDSATKTFVATGDPVGESKTVVLPWLAQADPDKALQQESDLYVHNPGPGSMEVAITFRRQGLPEADPPSVTRVIAEYGTLYLEDVVKGIFNRANSSGFLVLEPKDGDPQPVVTSFNRTFQGDLVYGQAVPGFSAGNGIVARESSVDVLHLVGLHDTTDRLGYFGLTNPTDERVDYNLSFFDKLGQLVGTTAEPLSIARFGQKKYRVEEIRETFGVGTLADYRVLIEAADGSALPVPWGANLRIGSNDPSFLRAGRTDAGKVFLVGALNTPGLNDSFFHTDLVLSNTSSEPAVVQVTFTGAGFQTEPTTPIEKTLPAGDTTRLTDVLSEWDLPNTVGALTIESSNSLSIYPVVQGESYDATNPDLTYGQFMPALIRDDAATSGKPVSIVGLRQDADHRSTIWLYNPGDELAEYNLRYFDHDGNELGGEDGVRLGAGKFRQINPGAHPVPEEGIADGFVVRVEVTGGEILASGQVVNQFNDPAYIVGR